MERGAKLGELLKDSKGDVIYFYNTTCASCNVLRPKVRIMIKRSFPGIAFHEINVEEDAQLTADATVYASPTIVVYFEGKETIRESRYISIPQLEEKIARYYEMIF